ncbi:family 20 glycosylhydrolase [Halosquirtibacter xylanolyticus]|uniref:family 20 glycosylhydrolase n=1 Tax=Halosquirtibacter xylanolyticus TaxID=3374599 RepID=UPI003748DFE8|nr:family 20 glycosylhydrolase [Prolixibacteraceae bacterium]
MKKRCIIICTLLVAVFLSSCSENTTVNEYPLIPYPESLSPKQGQFIVDTSTKIEYKGGDDAAFVASEFANFITKATGYKLNVSKLDKDNSNVVRFVEDTSLQGVKGSYQLTVNEDQVIITSNTPVGLFYGFQSLRQLLPVEIESKQVVANKEWTVPCVEIKDAPLLKYRGLMLDVGRHFFPVSFIKKYIDLLAYHKLNVFHWHLTEDQGWRIEIKKYPQLQKVAAYRNGTIVGHQRSGSNYDNKKYGGFYTQEEAREVVAYAAKRFVTVIPEIELPGHSQAALTAYPYLGCTGGPYEVSKRWGVLKEVYCAGNEQTFEFLQDVLTEVMDIFPSKYIHIGGDECPKERWSHCKKCQKRMKAENCKDEHELQSYFIQRVEKFLNANGRQIIGWDEILEGGLAPNATVMSWRGEKGGIEAAKQGHDVVMTPGSHCYLDHYQNTASEEPLAIGGFLPLSKVYSYNPFPASLTPDQKKHIIGVQGNVWTEYMPNSDHVEYMVYPRACALSEVAWLSSDKKSFSRFKKNMKDHKKRLELLGVNFFDKVLAPKPSVINLRFVDKGELAFENTSIDGDLFYTLDGSTPTSKSLKYNGPITITKPGVVKCINIISPKEKSTIVSVPVEQISYIEANVSKGTKSGLDGYLIKKKVSSCSQLKVVDGKRFTAKHVKIVKSAPEDHFGLIFNGVITVPEDNIYTFSIGSDDGSTLSINDKMLVNNDGAHGMQWKSDIIALKSGSYPISIRYFEGTGGNTLRLRVKVGNKKPTSIPAEWLSHN